MTRTPAHPLVASGPSSFDRAPIVYHVDAADRIVWLGDAWTPFARENDAPGLTPDVLLHHPLQAWVSGLAIWNLYALLLQKVRRTGEPVSFPYRCDGPALRRFLTMTLSSLPGGGVAFTSQLIRVEPRAPVALLDTRRARSPQFVTLCSWCKRAKLSGGRWGEVEEAVADLRLFADQPPPALTHGICRPCADRITALAE
ncbi:MAG: hypothetical protein KGN76_09620 [Acidobacteriota bacterium]|nr:hypothetical protein [Acidobacteriota bacterium]